MRWVLFVSFFFVQCIIKITSTNTYSNAQMVNIWSYDMKNVSPTPLPCNCTVSKEKKILNINWVTVKFSDIVTIIKRLINFTRTTSVSLVYQLTSLNINIPQLTAQFQLTRESISIMEVGGHCHWSPISKRGYMCNH